ncbi:MAG: glycosyltransferase, partial [Thermodesulfobacteriota bacterium]
MIKFRPIRNDEKVAIAIPTKNRHNYLAVLLASLAPRTYTNWMMVINDDRDVPVEENDTIKDLFALMKNKGNEVKVIHGKSGRERHQKAMEAVPESIEFIVRIDDDLMATPTFLQDILKPFYFFLDEPLAAVGGCYPEPHMKPINLDISLTDPSWISKFDEPTWRLQGHYYYSGQIIEVESLLGHAICYRRSAVEDVGGWAVDGYSCHAHREESDLCARLIAEGYNLMVTTDALAWHLYSPGGGSRDVKKTREGNFLVSDKRPIEEDDRLFQERLKQIINNKAQIHKELRRYEISDLENKKYRGYPLITFKGKLLRFIERK